MIILTIVEFKAWWSKLTIIIFIFLHQSRMLLEELEHVDHILENQGISLVKLDNPSAALEKFNVEIIPAIVHYQFKQPYFYKGDLTNEKKIVKWVLDIRENA